MYTSNRPMISVIVPVYNTGKVLHKCLESILQQAYRDFELILVDDGSTDNSGSVCDQVAKKDKRVRVFHKKNGGVSKARNIGIKKATGRWITFVDHDDMIPTGAFSAYSKYVERKDIDIIQGQVYKLCGKQDLFMNVEKDIAGNADILNVYDYSRLGGTYRTNVWGKLYRRSLTKNCYFPSNHYCEDVFFNGLFFSNVSIKNVVIIKSITYMYNRNDLSASHQWDVLDFYDMCRVMAVLYEKVKKRTDSSKIISEYLQLFFTQYYSYKYNIILRKGFKDAIKKNMLRMKRKYEKELLRDRNFSVGKKSALIALANINELYRMWVVKRDPTMLTYEKNVRKMIKNYDKNLVSNT